MHPYRPLHVATAEVDDDQPDDEHVLAWLFVVVGLVRVVPALCLNEALGTETMFAALLSAIGITMLGRHLLSNRAQR